jgi:hypothetical protein
MKGAGEGPEAIGGGGGEGRGEEDMTVGVNLTKKMSR